MYRYLIRPLFFLINAESAHYFALNLLRIVASIPGGRILISALYRPKNQASFELMGIEFPNRIGLAAGFDKNAKYLDLMALLGFGHVEIGTVTPKPQPGNDKPRLFRLPEDKALLNRMGFNNDGVEAVVKNLQKERVQFARNYMGLVVGGNIGKNKVTPNEDAWKDYVICFNELFDHVDYFVVNVSSPNTPGLRELQEKGPLLKILNKLQEINQSKTSPKPLLLKIAPDLSKDQLNDVIEVAVETNLTGLIISNTTINRDNLKTDRETVLDLGAGGISGKPVFEHSNAMLTTAYHKINGRFKLIGVGGVFDVNDYEKKLECGADLVQVYTGFIYSGPSTAKNILNS